MPEVEVIAGDTAIELPNVLADADEAAVILLDAHYCKLDPPIQPSEFPLWDELDLIANRPYADAVIVDDVHAFGSNRAESIRVGRSVEWEAVNPEVLQERLGRVAASEVIGDGFVMWRSKA